MECDNVIAITIATALKITYQRNASEEQEAQTAAMLKLFFVRSWGALRTPLHLAYLGSLPE